MKKKYKPLFRSSIRRCSVTNFKKCLAILLLVALLGQFMQLLLWSFSSRKRIPTPIIYAPSEKENSTEKTSKVSFADSPQTTAKLPVTTEHFTKLQTHSPRPFPASNNEYNISLYSTFENVQMEECFRHTEIYLNIPPIEHIYENITDFEKLDVMWKDITPHRTRVVYTPNMLELSTKRHLNMSIFPIIENSDAVETDFADYFIDNIDMFHFMSSIADPLHPTLDSWKNTMNDLNFVLNSDIFNEHQREDQLPIWIRTFQRIQPLDEVLKALCRVYNIEQSIVIVTIDGNGFMNVLSQLLKCKCVKMRIYFHPYKHNILSLTKDPSLVDRPDFVSTSLRLFTHALYGLFICFVKLKYPYVITLEDDIKPLPDYYNYHRSMYRLTLNETSPYLSVLSLAMGPVHSCRFISSSLFNEGIIKNMPLDSLGLKHSVCRTTDVNHVLPEKHHVIWGSGLPFRTFRRIFYTWISHPKRYEYFLGTIIRDMRRKHERNIAPCSSRVVRLDNCGANGDDGMNYRRFWTLAEHSSNSAQGGEATKNWYYKGREYVMMDVEPKEFPIWLQEC